MKKVFTPRAFRIIKEELAKGKSIAYVAAITHWSERTVRRVAKSSTYAAYKLRVANDHRSVAQYEATQPQGSIFERQNEYEFEDDVPSQWRQNIQNLVVWLTVALVLIVSILLVIWKAKSDQAL